MGLTKVRPDLFLMLINLIAPKLTVPNGTVIPEAPSEVLTFHVKLNTYCEKLMVKGHPLMKRKQLKCSNNVSSKRTIQNWRFHSFLHAN